MPIRNLQKICKIPKPKTLILQKIERQNVKLKITFLRTVMETNIHSKSFLKFDSAHFGI